MNEGTPASEPGQDTTESPLSHKLKSETSIESQATYLQEVSLFRSHSINKNANKNNDRTGGLFPQVR